VGILIEELSKSYGKQKALDAISFEVKRGEIAGFLGPNGAGKSTCMKILACALYPDSGNASVNGYNVIDRPDQAQKILGYLPENNPLYTDMYLREFLLFMGRIHKLGKDIQRKTEDIIEICGLGPESHKKIGELSKGYRQRVGLAQALLHDPDVIVLDEPTSGLDPNQIIEIRTLIRTIGKNKCVLLSSHIMQEVQSICDKVIIIDKGRIVADKKTTELLNEISENIYLSLSFKNEVSPEMFSSIQAIDDIRAENKHTLVFSSRNKDLREILFAFAVKEKLIITEMSGKNEGLESIFHRLTSPKKG
jgi:ABC-2 type transport system ATP-binding protein